MDLNSDKRVAQFVTSQITRLWLVDLLQFYHLTLCNTSMICIYDPVLNNVVISNLRVGLGVWNKRLLCWTLKKLNEAENDPQNILD